MPILCTAASLVGVLSCWLSHKFKLDQSMRLFVITFVLGGCLVRPRGGV
jgi:hypothetical protein